MQSLLLFAFLRVSNVAAVSTTYCQSQLCREGCTSYYALCASLSGCEWDSSANEGMCEYSDMYNDPTCCMSTVTTTEAATTTDEPTPAPTCPVSADCTSIESELCCDANACTWYLDDSCVHDTCEGVYDGECANDLCGSCTEPPTPEPTTAVPTTNEPTASPTCPVTTDCTAYTTEDCCLSSGACLYLVDDSCVQDTCEGVYNGDCAADLCSECSYPTPVPTPEPTTAEPTTSEPTTSEPTTSQPTTSEPTTDSPTTSSPTTNSPTTSTTEVQTTTTEAETTQQTEMETTEESEEEYTTTEFVETSTTKRRRRRRRRRRTTTTTTTKTPTSVYEHPSPRPTARPTLHSAMKWEMIHPAYTGGDGELLWHVYYGDFSDDDRFDAFRSKEMWDAQEIRPIIEADAKFAKFQEKNKKEAVLANSGDSTATLESSSSSESGGWFFLLLFVVMAAIFGCWYKYKRGDSKWFGGGTADAESQSLLRERPVSYSEVQ